MTTFIKARTLDTFSQKSRGLMFVKEPQPVFFTTRFGIHTFFMNFPIDILICDKNNCVVKITKDLKPWRILLWNPKFEKVFELPTGTVTKLKIKKGNRITYNS